MAQRDSKPQVRDEGGGEGDNGGSSGGHYIILNHQGTLPAAHVRDGQAVECGRIYVALPDHHLLLEGGAIHLSSGPREHYTRPAVDPLFRTAAWEYGPRVVAVLLSGGLSDGTAGMVEVKQHGGVTIVQDPCEATQPSMPQSAIDAVQVDHIVPAEEIAALLVCLTRGNEDEDHGSGGAENESRWTEP